VQALNNNDLPATISRREKKQEQKIVTA